jgi:hypothetical protein
LRSITAKESDYDNDVALCDPVRNVDVSSSVEQASRKVDHLAFGCTVKTLEFAKGKFRQTAKFCQPRL